jgi:hypothetical protein
MDAVSRKLPRTITLEDDVGSLWPYTSRFERPEDEILGDKGASVCPE